MILAFPYPSLALLSWEDHFRLKGGQEERQADPQGEVSYFSSRIRCHATRPGSVAY